MNSRSAASRMRSVVSGELTGVFAMPEIRRVGSGEKPFFVWFKRSFQIIEKNSLANKRFDNAPAVLFSARRRRHAARQNSSGGPRHFSATLPSEGLPRLE